MRILWNEMKKILTWKSLLLLLIINCILYFFLIDFYIKHFPNGRPALDSYRIGIEMIDKYGPSMDDEEFKDFLKTYDAQVKEADQYLQSDPQAVEEGIDTYKKFMDYDWNNAPQEVWKIREQIFFEEKVNTFWELQERERLIEFHELKEMEPGGTTPAQKKQYAKLAKEGIFGNYPEIVITNFHDYISNVAVAILFSVVAVMSPMILRDRTRQIVPLQYTARKGRSLLKTKLLAGFLSTLLVVTSLLVIYMGLYSLNNTSMFFDVRINTFIGNESWYNPTFLQYILFTIGGIYLVGIAFGLAAMGFSTIVPNTLTLLGVQIPFVAGFLIFGLNRMITFPMNMWFPKWQMPVFFGLLLLSSLIFVWYVIRREKKMDIML
ncbi:hypothetical protein NCCP2222_07090 [Sporosarcina sp. NCCP-2222]|uniref:hypothetical protein n=1 Tax=Sporosarcina sp. NCCP-2222 TaxID=2935073 RepID=UPI00207EF5F3|nr:hypothetical protein [Sporosarcina sp. NCCP-2222]GKV54762.1 hypothetical protein NCCP2222_07090 [Sporosarcina sp. NCCP-2222]